MGGLEVGHRKVWRVPRWVLAAGEARRVGLRAAVGQRRATTRGRVRLRCFRRVDFMQLVRWVAVHARAMEVRDWRRPVGAKVK